MRLFTIWIVLSLMHLSVFAAPSVWTGKVAEKFQHGEGKIEDPYLIKTPEEFALMAKKYADSAYYRLAEDIVLNEGDAKDWAKKAPKNKWTVYGDTAKYARVHLDGEGHSISGLYINSDKDYQGLFGAWTGVVANIKIKNSYVKGRNYVGTLAGVFGSEERWLLTRPNPFGNENNGHIVNIDADVVVEGHNFVGGLGGLLNEKKASIDSNGYVSYESKGSSSYSPIYQYDLTVSGSVQADSVVGGIFGSYISVSNDCMGLWNKASVTGSFDVGGIFGYLYSYNSSSPNSFINSGVVKGTRKVAGIIGGFAYNESPDLENLANLGAVSGKSRVAGLVNSDISKIRRNIYNSYNAGEITGDSVVSPLFYDDSCSRECLDTLHVYDLFTEHADSIHEYADSMGAYFFPDTGASPINKGLPVSAYFYPEKIYSHGHGIHDDPFLIASVDDLRRFERHAALRTSQYGKDTYRYYRQTADIVFPKENNEWTPVTVNKIHYDGGGHSISGFAIHEARLEVDSTVLKQIDASTSYSTNLDRYTEASRCTGFFRRIQDATIDNLKLKDIDVEGDFQVGGLIGCNYGPSPIVKRVSVEGTVKGLFQVGGIAGVSIAKFHDVVNHATVSGRKYVSGITNTRQSINVDLLRFVRNHGKVTGNAYVAGIVSEIELEGILNSYVYNRGDIIAEKGPAGGLFAVASTGTFHTNITNSYNASNVTAEKDYGAFFGILNTKWDWKESIDSMMLYDKALMNDPRNMYRIVNGNDSSLVSDAAFAAVDSKTLKSAGAKELGALYGADEKNENGGYPVFKMLKGNGTSDSPYLIETADDLWKLSELACCDIKLMSLYQNSHYKLIADIDLKASAKKPWVPIYIGVWGVFDGDGHTVSGIYVDSTRKDDYTIIRGGLFLNNFGTIKNLGIADSHIYGDTAGAIVAINAGVIENCWNKNAVVEASDVAGGIAGVMYPGVVATYAVMSDLEEYQAIANREVYINKAYNGGTIRSGDASAGIVGVVVDVPYRTDFVARRNVNMRIANSYNVGTAGAGIVWSTALIGEGIVEIKNVYDAGTGCTENGDTRRAQNVINSYFVDKNRKGCVNYGTPMTAKEMKTKDFAKKMGEAFKYDANGVNNGFPIFSDNRGFDPDEPFSVKQQRLVYKALQVSVAGREIRIDNMIEDVNTALFDLRGKRVWSGTGKSAVIPVQKAGVYIVRNKYQMAKIVVR
ncbi:MAG: hypothetical protein II892_01305 [Fibrobacter sp.]|nr:hypothetical protein [Fibrobacter sp.]